MSQTPVVRECCICGLSRRLQCEQVFPNSVRFTHSITGSQVQQTPVYWIHRPLTQPLPSPSPSPSPTHPSRYTDKTERGPTSKSQPRIHYTVSITAEYFYCTLRNRVYASFQALTFCGVNSSTGKLLRITSRASAISLNSPEATIWTAILPIPVASIGPVTT